MNSSDSNSPNRISADQLRAQAAQKSVADLPVADREDYFGEAKKLPVRIMASGLGQALAFIAAKAKKRSSLKGLQADLSTWVLKRIEPAACNVNCPPDTPPLLHCIIHGDSAFVRRATDETLAYLKWLNRFAEAASTGP